MNDKRIERYLAGEMPEPERIAFEREILESPELAAMVYADAQVVSALTAAAEERQRGQRAGHPEAGRRAWWRLPALRWAVPVAAVAAAIVVFAVVVRTPETPGRREVFRGAQPGFVPVSPVGVVGKPPTQFVWTARRGAVRYRVELFDTTSTLVQSVVTADTAVTMTVGGPAAVEGYWRVTPLDQNFMSLGHGVVARYRVAPR